ncbi:HAD hydrolase-like protein [Streptococcus catagoni]|uniref:HAD hydrolase-like protein n=1 Tax=Streptococcus catagoni TaxID=2654874 RepID=UPI00140E7AB7|nr:HAD hydrolase-like protein [Streptococcus catagoni]
MKAILFDLDGTLVDSSLGILNAFQRTFKQLDLSTPDKEVLSTYIGPPLETTFANYFLEESEINLAISHFRQFYKKEGVYQVTLYEGITTLLKKLNDSGYYLYLTTSKHEPMANVMLEELGIKHFFKAIYGSREDRFLKADIIKACLLDFSINPEDAIIIGDTSFDIIGGKENKIKTLGVTWGFGKKTDFQVAGADHIADSLLEVYKLLVKNK